MELAPWKAGPELQVYTEGLRERLMTYFEVSNLNLKKPKLVAVTGCGDGAGTTTLAGGLAASLSKTGDGNVLLVDMNVGQGVAHSFYKGQPARLRPHRGPGAGEPGRCAGAGQSLSGLAHRGGAGGVL